MPEGKPCGKMHPGGKPTMKNRFYLLLVAVILLSLILPGCTKSAAPALTPTPADVGEIPFPLATQPDVMSEILSSTATALALAAGGAATPESEAATPEGEVQPEVQPTPKPTNKPAEESKPTQPPTAPTSTPGRPASWTIQPGEHIYCIARRFNVNPADLININNLANPNIVKPGTKLTIPTGSSWPSSMGKKALKPHPTSYTVQTGDTIYTIACSFGDVSPDAIAAANNLSSPYNLNAGQTLQIP
jgi:LysM repeat protein